MFLSRGHWVVLVIAFLVLRSHASAGDREFRALWVDGWGTGFLNQGQVDGLLQEARTNNFNAIVVQMRRRGDAFYMPQAPNGDPRTTAIASGFDALAAVIAAAHTGSPRIEVHCWVTTFPVWGAGTPSQPGHIFNLHPEYLMKSSTGETSLAEGYYVDPGHPDAMRWTARVAKDIVTRYNVDGFHWDYIRYPQQDSGYNVTALSRYNQEFGLTGQPLPNNTQFSNWRRRQVTDFLRWINADLQEIRPELIISAAVFANRSDAYTHRLQDWSSWNTAGIIDLCMPMNYTANNSIFNSRVNDFLNHQGSRRIYVGPGAYLNTRENTLAQLNYVRDAGLLGTTLYSYRTPNSETADRAGTFDYIRTHYQPTWKDTPELPWKATTGIAKGLVINGKNGELVYNAQVNISSVGVPDQKSCVQGGFAFYNLPGGTWTISASAGDLVASETVTLAPGQVIHVDLVLNEGTAEPPEITPLADFEDLSLDGGSGTVLFRNPLFSGTTSANLQTTPNSALVIGNPPAGGGDERSLRVAFAFLPDRDNPWLRLTTHGIGGSILPNPIIPLDRRLRFDIHSNQDVYVAIGIRDNGAIGAVGSNGGSAGGIEWVGGTTDNVRASITGGGVPPLGRLVKAGSWTTLDFNLPEEPVKPFTGNGILTGIQGVLEEIAIVPVITSEGSYFTGPIEIHLDNFNLTNEPVPVPSSYESWAAASLPAQERGRLDDPGGHGIANFLRYAFDMDPLAPSPLALPRLALTEEAAAENRPSITFTRRTDDPELDYLVETSSDLEEWDPFAGTEQIEPRDEKTETVTVTDTSPLDGWIKRFLRLRIQ